MKFNRCWILVAASACGGSTGITPGTPRAVAQAAAAAYQAAGHDCQVKADLAYCDTSGGALPLLMGYNVQRHELMFATVYDTEAGFGRTCPSIAADQIVHPEWMVVKCDQIEFDNKARKVVLSVLGGGRIPDQGMSRAELNRSAGLFIQEAEGYLVRLRGELAQHQQAEPQRASDVKSTKL